MKPIKTLVVGYGLSGKAFHVPFLLTNPAYQLAGIVQPRGTAARQEFPHLQHFNTLEDALGIAELELVIVASPNEWHAPMARKALEAGKHVLVEKPFATTAQEAAELCTLAAKQQKILSVYHNRRWDADFLTLKQVLKDHRIGKAVVLVSRFDRFRPQIKPGWKEEPKPGTGVFYDLGPHLIDQALQLWGWPTSLYAHIRTERAEAKTQDAFDLVLYYPNLSVQLGAGTLVSAPWPRYSLLGSTGSYTKWGWDPQEELLRAGVLPNTADWGTEPAAAWGTLVWGNNESTQQERYATQKGSYHYFYDALALAIRGKGPNPVPAEEALQVMQLMELAWQSQHEGRRLPCTQ